MRTIKRCPWAGNDPLMQAYHDREWGRPLHDERALFEFLILEGAQAGLSWRTILAKREHYRKVFDGFDAAKIAHYTLAKVERLLADPGIVRNRLKVEAAVGNARAYLALCERYDSLDGWLWNWVGGRPIVNRWRNQTQVPARTELSDRISSELRQCGFKFVGSTIVYAFMQATGMVCDHLAACSAHPQAVCRPQKWRLKRRSDA
ncbi:MAG: DNA-3-methyladenine glycosylase I [Gammaproteobacteria bacterium]|nr:DNA-3-methyladenine glycosylase I [Gammaproteobacteria bacterium]